MTEGEAAGIMRKLIAEGKFTEDELFPQPSMAPLYAFAAGGVIGAILWAFGVLC